MRSDEWFPLFCVVLLTLAIVATLVGGITAALAGLTLWVAYGFGYELTFFPVWGAWFIFVVCVWFLGRMLK